MATVLGGGGASVRGILSSSVMSRWWYSLCSLCVSNVAVVMLARSSTKLNQCDCGQVLNTTLHVLVIHVMVAP